MKKYTRKHYNKKLIAFGLSLFMGIGITSTGFAAWVMSRDAEEQATDGVNVAIIEDASVEITLWKWVTSGEGETPTRVVLTERNENDKLILDDDFSFDSIKGDKGRLRADENANEDLIVTVNGTVVTNGVGYDLTATLELPENIQAAIEKGYISLKGNYLTGEKVNLVTVNENNSDFTIVLEFEWGKYFNNMNPCLYYDKDPTGMAVSNTDMEAQMLEFRKTMLGLTDSDDSLKTYAGDFTLTLSATPSVVEEDPEQGTV